MLSAPPSPNKFWLSPKLHVTIDRSGGERRYDPGYEVVGELYHFLGIKYLHEDKKNAAKYSFRHNSVNIIRKTGHCIEKIFPTFLNKLKSVYLPN